MKFQKVILVVDDEPRIRQGLQKTLELSSNDNVTILTATNGKEALNIILNEKVHLLITDISMPEMTGLQLVKNIQSVESKPEVIVISAYSEFDYAQEAIQYGVQNYLLKPISKQKLFDSVQKALKAYENREQVGMMQKVVDDRLLPIVTRENNTSPPVKKALTYIDENIKERLTLQRVADYIHLNSSYFSVLFKEQTSLTFSEYVTRRRLLVAKKLLYQTQMSVAEIAEEVGYHTSKYFIKMFKDYEGVTPSQYRKQETKTS
ncbi:response regulator transcription factor [Bacillus alkalicellulosilyticus]|uniref:response regulator transcription factor n=1 Tax=Alkalihalobacterium alkalicellulosilyticum TaxID=1912214 RepID=UPI00099606A2|nr:response regulator [Bacillus alkalicellulosilyticus]